MPPVILPRSQHNVSRRDIDPEAVKVLYRLHRSGYVAYLVGGGVRDLLLGRRPKDFDIGTSAHPGEVRKLFRNCRLIGRRFRLAHIIFGRDKIVEVATFRQKADEPAEGDELIVRSDNTFGTPEEDAERRDITINGLFYDIATFSVIDFVGGLEDLEQRTIRTIGNPNIRLREDPVRMLRVIKFAARLRFRIADDDIAAIRQHGSDLLLASPERLRLELGRLLGGGYAAEAFKLLDFTGLLRLLAPELAAILERERAHGTDEDSRYLWRVLRGLDAIVARRPRGDSLPQPVLLSILMMPLVVDRPSPQLPIEIRRGLGFATPSAPGPSAVDASVETSAGVPAPLIDAEDVETAIAPIVARFSVPRRESEQVVRLLAVQPRLFQPGGRATGLRTILRRPYFLDALLVLEAAMRGGLGGETQLQRWHDAAERSPELVVDEPPDQRRGRRRKSGGVRRRHSDRDVPRERQPVEGNPAVDHEVDSRAPVISWPPDARRRSKRRRSRRKPVGSENA